MTTDDPNATASAGDATRKPHWFVMWGWVIALGLLVGIAAPVWHILIAGDGLRPAIGDGADIETYAFDLSNLTVPRHLVAALPIPKDQVPALTDPAVVLAASFREINRDMYGKFLVEGDTVIGVSVNGEARAYPLRIIAWHEVVNDTLGGVPILVTYSRPSESVVVFDRTVGGDVLEFGVSGLVHNANLLLFDRRDDVAQESLWSQLKFQPVAGPAVERGDQLNVRPCLVTTLQKWLARHPQSTVIRGDIQYGHKRYNQNVPPSDAPAFPIAPTPDANSRIAPLSMIDARRDADGQWVVTPWQRPTVRVSPTVAEIAPEQFAEITQPTVYARWFAWYAFHSDDSRVARAVEALE